MQAYFGKVKVACLCSYCYNHNLWCYDRRKIRESKYSNPIRVGARVKEGKGGRGRGRGEKNTLSFLFSLPAPLPRSFWLAPFSPLFSSFKMVLSQAKHLPTWRKRLHCRLNRNQSESITRIDNFSTFQSHDIHLLALLGPFTGPNDRFPYTFIHFILWNPYPFSYLKPEKGTPSRHSLPI